LEENEIELKDLNFPKKERYFVCFNGKKETFIPCGHLDICGNCPRRNRKCIVCNQDDINIMTLTIDQKF
jgi:hypothetical protein